MNSFIFYLPHCVANVGKPLLLCVWLLSAAASTDAQINFVHMEYIGRMQDFPADVVWKCVRDEQGFMWYATEEGLFRWDGVNYLSFRYEITDSTAFEDNGCFDLIMDHEGMLWTITRNTLCKINTRTLKVERVPHKAASFKTPINNVQRLTALLEDKQHRIWISSSYGVFVLDAQRIPSKYFAVEPVEGKNDFNNCQSIIEDNRGNIWVSSYAGLLKIDGASYGISRFPVGKDVYPARAIISWQDKIWMADDSLYVLDELNGRFRSIQHSDFGNGWPHHLLTKTGDSDTLWIAFRNGGLGNYVLSKNQFNAYSIDDKRERVIPGSVMSLALYDGCLWLCGGACVYRYLPDNQFFGLMDIRKELGDKNAALYNIFPDEAPGREGMNYVTTSKGFYHWKPRTNEWTKLPWPRDEKGKELVSPNFFSQDSKGNWWWNMGFDGVYKCHDGKCRMIIRDSEVEPGYRDYRWYMSTVKEDNRGRVWIAAESKLALYEGEQITLLTPPPVVSTSGDTLMPKPSFRQFIFDGEENIWLISDFSGQKSIAAIYRYNTTTKTFHSFSYGDGSNFPNVNNLNDIVLVNGRIWCAAEGGVIWFDAVSNSTPDFHLLGYSQGMPSVQCSGIVGDGHGNVWVTTYSGLIRITPKFDLQVFTKNDGLEWTKLPWDIRHGSDGTCYIHNYTFANYFNPERFVTTTLKKGAFITSILVNNKPLTTDTAFSYLKSLQLSWQENTISLSFSALDYFLQKKTEYAYRLDGVDRDWNYSGYSNAVTYSNLPGGDYVFRVKTRTNSGEWNEEAIVFPIYIATAWFRTIWFYSLVVLLVLLGIWLLYRYRVRQLMKIQAVRNKIASDLHDDVGSALSSLVIYSDVLASKLEQGESGEGIVKKIRETSSKSVESMRDIVWSLNTRNDDLETMVQYMKRTAQDLVDPAGMELHFEYELPDVRVVLTPDQRKNVFLILKEAVNNARKYSTAANIWVSIQCSRHHLRLIVKDDGRGFDISQPTEGNGMGNMHKRAKQIGGQLHIKSGSDRGVELELNVPLHTS